MKFFLYFKNKQIKQDIINISKVYTKYSNIDNNLNNIPSCNINEVRNYVKFNWLKILHRTDRQNLYYQDKLDFEKKLSEIDIVNENDPVKEIIVNYGDKNLLRIVNDEGINIRKYIDLLPTRYLKYDILNPLKYFNLPRMAYDPFYTEYNTYQIKY